MCIYRCLIDIAAGMDYLHSVGVLHGDLKAANVLCKSTATDPRGFTCKVGALAMLFDLLRHQRLTVVGFAASVILQLCASPWFPALKPACYSSTPMLALKRPDARALELGSWISRPEGGVHTLYGSRVFDIRALTCACLDVQLADFGLSRLLDPTMTHVSTKSYGTISYMPSEVLKDGRLTTAADVYSFALMMWETYASQALFEGQTMAQVGSAPLRHTAKPDLQQGVADSSPGSAHQHGQRALAALQQSVGCTLCYCSCSVQHAEPKRLPASWCGGVTCMTSGRPFTGSGERS